MLTPVTWEWVRHHALGGMFYNSPPFNTQDFILVIGPNFAHFELLKQFPGLRTYQVADVKEFTKVEPYEDCVLALI